MTDLLALLSHASQYSLADQLFEPVPTSLAPVCVWLNPAFVREASCVSEDPARQRLTQTASGPAVQVQYVLFPGSQRFLFLLVPLISAPAKVLCVIDETVDPPKHGAYQRIMLAC
jgi:hypothetical protein